MRNVDWIAVIARALAAFALAILVFQCSGQEHQFVAALAGAWSGLCCELGVAAGENEWNKMTIVKCIIPVVLGAFGGLMFFAKG